MASTLQASTLFFAFATFILMFMGEQAMAAGIFRPSQWALAHATFYGDETASATMGMYMYVCVSHHYHILVFLKLLVYDCCRRSMRVREFISKWLRDRHGGFKFYVVQQWLCVRNLLSDKMLPIKCVL